ncbi:MAG: hypothetical protein APR53_10675 [Methanoculleus sp. SDB]|nr:MAG: hypothetical protein APR53_10675 [Methanoculleus sp. SDB]
MTELTEGTTAPPFCLPDADEQEVCMAYFSFLLVRSTARDEGHALVRRLYLTWGGFMALFIVIMLL